MHAHIPASLCGKWKNEGRTSNQVSNFLSRGTSVRQSDSLRWWNWWVLSGTRCDPVSHYIGDVNIKQGKTVISSCIHGTPYVLVDNHSSHPRRLQLGPWGQCNNASSMAYHLPCKVSPPQSPPWRNWQLQESMLISALVVQFSHQFSTLPPCFFIKWPFNAQVLLTTSPYFAVLFDLPLPSPVPLQFLLSLPSQICNFLHCFTHIHIGRWGPGVA